MNNKSCLLSAKPGETTVYIPGEGCEDLANDLRSFQNGTLWVSLTLEDDPGLWLTLTKVDDDSSPTVIDRRGRYLGCKFAAQGVFICLVNVEIDDQLYRVEIPIIVGPPLGIPAQTAAPTVEGQPTATPGDAPPANPGDPCANPTDPYIALACALAGYGYYGY